jgi:hypothetical protein
MGAELVKKCQFLNEYRGWLDDRSITSTVVYTVAANRFKAHDLHQVRHSRNRVEFCNSQFSDMFFAQMRSSQNFRRANVRSGC